MTEKEYKKKKAKLFWFDFVALIIILAITNSLFLKQINYLYDGIIHLVLGLVCLTIYFLLIIFIIAKPYVRLSNILEMQGYEQTEKEIQKQKLKHDKYMERWTIKYQNKHKKSMIRRNKKWKADNFQIRTIDDLRKASLMQIIKWRMK